MGSYWSKSNNNNNIYTSAEKIIDGSECLKNPDLYLNRIGNKFATVKENIGIRCYKRTDAGHYRSAMTTLIIPSNSKIHLPLILHKSLMAEK
jgi:hypothetical protein